MFSFLVIFSTITHLLPATFTLSSPSSSTSFPSPLCRRLEAFSLNQRQSSLDLKMFSLYRRTIYLVDEEDDLYELSINNLTVNLLYSEEELPLFLAESSEKGSATRWVQPVGKWYNHPWLRLDTVNSPLARLQLFSDNSGETLWRQYLFANGRHCLVNNRTGRVVVIQKGRELKDYLVINSKIGGLLFHYDNYSWLRNSKLSFKDRRVVLRPTYSRFSRKQMFYMNTNVDRSTLYLSNSKPSSTSNDLLLKLPIGGLFLDNRKKLFLLTGKFTREVIIVKDFRTLNLPPIPSKQKRQAICTKSWSSFFRCWPNTTTVSKGVDQSDYLKVASMVVDDREIPGTVWAKVAAYIIASVIVLTGCFFVYPRSASSKINYHSESSSSSSLTSLTSSPLDRKSKLRLSDLKLNNKRSSRSSSSSSRNSSSSSSSSVLSSKTTQVSSTLGKLPPKELTTIKPLDCSSVENIIKAIN